MTKFEKRTTAPSKNSKYYYSDNIFYKCGYGMPNCTCYAWGRFYELSGKTPKLCTANAENWYKYKDGYARGKTPKLGAVIVWAKGVVGNSKDGAGHVAVVEEIYSDGSILTSNSAYNSTNFYTKKIPNTYKLNGYKFQGFIYNPVEFKQEVNRVMTLQASLNKCGASLVIDGIIGSKTEKAIKKYYKKSHVIKWVQINLNELGYNCGTADGISGSKTKSGVKAYQKAKKLTADGIAGIKTIKSICNE